MKTMSLFHDTNSNMHSQRGRWERGRSPVGRVALIPTSVYINNEFYRSIETLYANLWRMRIFYLTYRYNSNLAQAVQEVPWGHNILIFQKCKEREEIIPKKTFETKS